jgi:hypothetical protein
LFGTGGVLYLVCKDVARATRYRDAVTGAAGRFNCFPGSIALQKTALMRFEGVGFHARDWSRHTLVVDEIFFSAMPPPSLSFALKPV